MAVGILMTRLIPPFQSPDENAHHWRAAMLANGQLLLQPSGHGVRDSGMVDENFARYSEAAAMQRPHDPALDPAARQGIARLGSELHWGDKEISVLAAGTGYYTPVLYVPHTLALWIAKRLNLSMAHTYELTRAFVIGTALSIAFYACAIWRPNLLMLLLLLTPMSLFQWYSATVDGLANALLLLLLALWLKRWRGEDEGKSWRDEALIYVIVFTLCTTRTHLLPVLLIPATLLAQRFSWRRLLALGLLTLAVLGWQAYAASVSGQHVLNRTHSTREIIAIYAAHPLEFFETLVRTFQSERLVAFYTQSFVGLLGWLDVPLGPRGVREIYFALLLGLVLTVAFSRPWQRRDAILRCSAVVMAASSFFIAFFALAVSWNDFPANTVEGIQGRYFIPVAVILAFGFGSLDLRRKYRWPELTLLLAFVVYSLLATSKLLINYYYLNPLDAPFP